MDFNLCHPDTTGWPGREFFENLCPEKRMAHVLPEERQFHDHGID